MRPEAVAPRARPRCRPGARAGLVAGTALAASLGLVSAAVAEYSARTHYVLHCQGCHGADGVGGTPGEVPPLARSVGWFLRVPGGREYLAQVPGAANAPISDAALAALLNYMIETYSRAEAGDAYRPYRPEDVSAVRRSRPDVVRLRAGLVETVRRRFGVRLWTESGYARSEPAAGVEYAVDAEYDVPEGMATAEEHARP